MNETMINATTTEPTETITPQNAAQNLNLPTDYEKKLKPEQQMQVRNMAKSIDITNRGAVAAFGFEQQTSLGKFAESMISGTGSSELGEAGQLLNNAMAEIRGYNEKCENKGFLSKIFTNPKSIVKKLKDSYLPVSKKIEVISKELVDKKVAIERVYNQFESLFLENKQTYEYLTMVIYAGEEALKEAQQKLAVMQSDPSVDPQDLRDYSDQVNDFDKRLYDLKITRTVAISLAPQIRSVQKSASNVGKSIDTALNTSIPMWKTQVAMALGIRVVQDGLNVTNAVNDFTNQMLSQISEAGKQLAIESAKANARGVVDLDVIRKVNQNTIEGLTESTRITREAIEERKKNSEELKAIEANLVSAVREIK